MAFVALPEDIYAGGPSNDLLRFWLSQTIDRERAEASLSTPSYAPSGACVLILLQRVGCAACGWGGVRRGER